jgi:hypothetical protein
MRAFAFRIELDRLTGIQRPFHADIGMHQRPSIFRSHDYGLCRRLPVWLALFGLGQLQDVIGDILERDELPAAGQRDRIFEGTFPAAISHLWPVATRPDIGGAFGLASPQTN